MRKFILATFALAATLLSSAPRSTVAQDSCATLAQKITAIQEFLGARDAVVNTTLAEAIGAVRIETQGLSKTLNEMPGKVAQQVRTAVFVSATGKPLLSCNQLSGGDVVSKCKADPEATLAKAYCATIKFPEGKVVFVNPGSDPQLLSVVCF